MTELELHVPGVTVPATIFSLVLTVASLCICMLTMNGHKKVRVANVDAQVSDARNTAYVYYRNTARMASTCNLGCCCSVSLYCIWIIFEPEQELAFFITLRALPTLFWFLGKASLIWLYNGVLFFAFKNSSFATSSSAFKAVNVLILLAVPVHLVLGYVGVFYGMPWMISLGFEGYRIEYILMTWYLLFRSVRKMLKVDAYEKKCSTPQVLRSPVAGNEKPDTLHRTPFFLSVATKNSVLVSFVSASACCVAICWTLFDFALGQSYLTLLVPMLMFSVDGVIDSICIYLFFPFGEASYSKWCQCVNSCCQHILARSVQDIANKMNIDEATDRDVEAAPPGSTRIETLRTASFDT